MTKDEFYQEVVKVKKAHPEWRIGQALFNTLFEARPDIANTLKGTPDDPFVCNTVRDLGYLRATEKIEELWGPE